MATKSKQRAVPMAGTGAITPGIVAVASDLPDPNWVLLDDGYAVPDHFNVLADLPEDTHAEIEVEVESKRARVRSVKVSTERTGGVNATAMRSVPIRDAVSQGCWFMLHRATASGFVPVLNDNPGPADAEAISRLVGYVEVKPR